MSLRLHTNAKVNLFLEVREKMADGFHSIQTIFQSVSLADRLTVEMTDAPLHVGISRGAAKGTLPQQPDNIVTRAAISLAGSACRQAQGRIDIVKEIPIAAGLAGGSANAAGALVALQDLWGTDADLTALGADLGADVPFCLVGGTALATGRGEVLTSLPTPDLWFVLGIDPKPLSTRDVYSAWRPGDQGEVPASEMTRALQVGDSEAIAATLRNDLEFPAFRLRPELREKKQALTEAGALGVLLSGSGPTLFGLASGEEHATDLAERCRGNFDRVEVVCSTTVCVAPEGSDS